MIECDVSNAVKRLYWLRPPHTQFSAFRGRSSAELQAHGHLVSGWAALLYEEQQAMVVVSRWCLRRRACSI